MNVLIVDDNQALAENLGEFLEDEGHRVRLADGAEAAMALIGGERVAIDFALVDICLGSDDGVELAERLKGARPGLRLALMTAHSSEGRMSRAEALELGPIFPKPVPLEALVRLISP